MSKIQKDIQLIEEAIKDFGKDIRKDNPENTDYIMMSQFIRWVKSEQRGTETRKEKMSDIIGTGRLVEQYGTWCGGFDTGLMIGRVIEYDNHERTDNKTLHEKGGSI